MSESVIIAEEQGVSSHCDPFGIACNATIFLNMCHLLLQVVVHTSDIRGAGTDASVYIVLAGEQGASPRCDLVGAHTAVASAFGRGGIDSFTVQATELGDLHTLTIGTSNNTQQL